MYEHTKSISFPQRQTKDGAVGVICFRQKQWRGGIICRELRSKTD